MQQVTIRRTASVDRDQPLDIIGYEPSKAIEQPAVSDSKFNRWRVGKIIT